jgi:transporter family protein
MSSPSIKAPPPPTAEPRAAARGIPGWVIPTLIYIVTTGGLGITSKLALEHLKWPDLILWSGLGYAAVVVVMVIRGDARPRFVAGTGWAILATAVAIGGLIALYVALTNGEAGKVVSISAAYPAVTLIFSAMFLGERLSPARVIGVAMVVGGVVVVTAA